MQKIGSIASGRLDRSHLGDSNNITLIMLSGGVDSTAALVKLLAETSEHIHAHHVHLKNWMNRADAELQATYAIVKYCKSKFRPFDFTVSTLDLTFLRTIPPDVFHSVYIASLMIGSDPRIKKFVRGVIADDELDPTYPVRRNVSLELYRALTPEDRRPEYIHPLREMTKIEVLASLPTDLLEMTWSCRIPDQTPGGFRRCGRCKTCEKVESSLDALGYAKDWLRREVVIDTLNTASRSTRTSATESRARRRS